MIIGEAVIQISPKIASDFDAKLKGQIGPSLEKAGQLGGQQAGRAVSSSFGASTAGIGKSVQAPLAAAGKAGGSAAGQAAASEFRKGAAKGGDEAGKEAGKRFGAGLTGTLSALGGFFVARRVFQFFSGAIGVLAKFEVLSAQTNAAIKSTGGVANVTAAHVKDLAGSIEDLTTIDDKAVQGAANLLLTFTGVRNEVGKGNDIFDQAVASLTDMSVALGSDVTGSAIQLGKALNDPILGVTALRRVGVAFTADQQKLIASLVNSGHLLDAQKIILKELTTEFGGSAKALGGTIQGSLNRAGDSFENLQKKVGSAIAPIVIGLGAVATVAGKIPGPVIATVAGFAGFVAVTLTVTALSRAVKSAFVDIGAFLARLGILKVAEAEQGIQALATAGAQGAVATASGAVATTSAEAAIGVDALAASEGAAAIAGEGLAASQTAASGAMGRLGALGSRALGALASPLGLVATGVAAVAFEVYAFNRRIDATGEGLQRFRKATTALATDEDKLKDAHISVAEAESALIRIRAKSGEHTAAYKKALGALVDAEFAAATANKKVFEDQRAQLESVGTTLEKVFKPGVLDRLSKSRGPDVMRQLAAAMGELEKAGIPAEAIVEQISQLDISPDQKKQLETLAIGFKDYAQAAESARAKAQEAFKAPIDFATSEKAFSGQLHLVDSLVEKYGALAPKSNAVGLATQELTRLTVEHALGLAREQTALGHYTDAQVEIDAELTALKARYPELATQIDGYAKGVKAATASGKDHKAGLADVEGELEDTKDAYDKTTDALGEFQNALDRSLGIFESAKDAENDYQSAIDDLAESLKENGRSFDANTEKGRKNREAVKGVVEGVKSLTEVYIRQTPQIESADESQQILIENLNRARRDVLPSARAEFDEYIRSLGGIPGAIGAARGPLEHLDTQLRSIKLNSNIRAKVEAFVRDDPKFSVKDLDKFLRNLGLSKTARVAIEAAVNIGLKINPKTDTIVVADHGRLRLVHEGGWIKAPGASARDISQFRVAHEGGFISGSAVPARDVPIIAQAGEYMLQRSAARSFDPRFLEFLNRVASRADAERIMTLIRGKVTGFHSGGFIARSASLPPPVYHTGGSVSAGAGTDPILGELQALRALIAQLLARPAQVNVNEVHQDPRATAFAVSARLGLEATR